MSFRNTLSQFWNNVQETLFSEMECVLRELSSDHKHLISILELVRIEEFLPRVEYYACRPAEHRSAIARAFVAKMVFKITYTKQLVNLLKVDRQLREICGFGTFEKIPSESKFSRVFREFAQISLPDKVHEALIKSVYKDQIIGHLVKDSVPLISREKSLKKESAAKRKKIKAEKSKQKRKGELNNRQRQLQETNLTKMIKDLPKACDKGMKRSAQGYTTIWKGYKLHAAVDDHCIPVAAIITSASLNDSEVAIPLALKSNLVVKNFYDVMDAAYDHPEIKEHSISLGHVPLIDKCPHGKVQKAQKEANQKKSKLINFQTAEQKRYAERFPKERFNAMYKDYNGGRTIFYKGYSRVSCHVMFGVLTLAASTILRLSLL